MKKRQVLNSGDVGLRLKAIGFPLPPLENDLSSFGFSEAVPVESLGTAELKPDEKIFDMVKYNQSGYSKYTRILLEVCCGEDSLMCSPSSDHDDCLCFRLTERHDLTSSKGLKRGMDVASLADFLKIPILVWISCPMPLRLPKRLFFRVLAGLSLSGPMVVTIGRTPGLSLSFLATNLLKLS